MTIDYMAKRPEAVADTECFPNLWAIGFMDRDTKKKRVIAKRDGVDLDIALVKTILGSYKFYTFNGINYDLPMILYALKGASNSALKMLNDLIIPGGNRKGMPYWEVFDQFDLAIPRGLDHIDLWNVAPSAAQKASLKKYAAMMHSKRMRDLPYDPSRVLSDHEIDEVLSYLGNDLDVTADLAEEMQPQILLRSELSKQYNFDFRSKSDAQCGEAVMKLLVEKEKNGQRVYKPDIRPGPFKYVAPSYVKFQTPYMQGMLDKLLYSDFVVRGDGYVLMPDMFYVKKSKAQEIEDIDFDTEYEGGAAITIGSAVYKMGIGGLHSQEKRQSFAPGPDELLVDTDVVSYYPKMMIFSGREPDNMRGYFKRLFEDLVKQRVAAKAKSTIAKRNGDKDGEKFWKTRAESLKIFINGIFGKTGSPFSVVYSPQMMIQTTVTGQLSILMLIEDLTLKGFKVISANTDGFVTVVPKARKLEFDCIVFEWGCMSGLDTEEVRYRSIHSRDVNNYVAFPLDPPPGYKPVNYVQFPIDLEGVLGKMKRKGAYAPSGRGQPGAFGLKKMPNAEICTEAAIAFLRDGTRPESVIRNCKDIRQFVVARAVQGGAEQDGEYIGKVVRFYYGVDSPGPLTYKLSGNRVPRSEGAVECMVLPDELPDDIDYAWYEREAYNILDDMGVDVPDVSLKALKGVQYARIEDQKTFHRVDATTGIALCGHERKSRRDMWNAYRNGVDNLRLCKKCEKANDL